MIITPLSSSPPPCLHTPPTQASRKRRREESTLQQNTSDESQVVPVTDSDHESGNEEHYIIPDSDNDDGPSNIRIEEPEPEELPDNDVVYNTLRRIQEEYIRDYREGVRTVTDFFDMEAMDSAEEDLDDDDLDDDDLDDDDPDDDDDADDDDDGDPDSDDEEDPEYEARRIAQQQENHRLEVQREELRRARIARFEHGDVAPPINQDDALPKQTTPLETALAAEAQQLAVHVKKQIQQDPDETEPECLICLGPLAEDTLGSGECGHVFHHTCLQELFNIAKHGTPKCPLCRASLMLNIQLRGVNQRSVILREERETTCELVKAEKAKYDRDIKQLKEDKAQAERLAHQNKQECKKLQQERDNLRMRCELADSSESQKLAHEQRARKKDGKAVEHQIKQKDEEILRMRHQLSSWQNQNSECISLQIQVKQLDKELQQSIQTNQEREAELVALEQQVMTLQQEKIMQAQVRSSPAVLKQGVRPIVQPIANPWKANNTKPVKDVKVYKGPAKIPKVTGHTITMSTSNLGPLAKLGFSNQK